MLDFGYFNLSGGLKIRILLIVVSGLLTGREIFIERGVKIKSLLGEM